MYRTRLYIMVLSILVVSGCGQGEPGTTAPEKTRDKQNETVAASSAVSAQYVRRAGSEVAPVSDEAQRALDSFLASTVVRLAAANTEGADRMFLMTHLDMLVEFDGLRLIAQPKESLTQADRLNGVLERQVLVAQFDAARRERGSEWDEWKPPGRAGGVAYIDSGLPREMPLRVQLELLDSGWKVVWQQKDSFRGWTDLVIADGTPKYKQRVLKGVQRADGV